MYCNLSLVQLLELLEETEERIKLCQQRGDKAVDRYKLDLEKIIACLDKKAGKIV